MIKIPNWLSTRAAAAAAITFTDPMKYVFYENSSLIRGYKGGARARHYDGGGGGGGRLIKATQKTHQTDICQRVIFSGQHIHM